MNNERQKSNNEALRKRLKELLMRGDFFSDVTARSILQYQFYSLATGDRLIVSEGCYPSGATKMRLGERGKDCIKGHIVFEF